MKQPKNLRETAKKIAWVAFLLFILGLISFAVLFLSLSKSLPSLDQIINRKVVQSTKIYDRTGQVLLYEISNGQKRTSVPFNELPKSLKDATVAIEDARFYEEPGFSVKGILRALLTNLMQGKILQGGSTITQQLAKNAFLSPEQTITRKIKEFLLAIRLNRYYTKDEILGLYLNEIPYGPTLYGVESASQAFFNKPARDLTLGESAVLAALAKAPSYYSPWGTHKKELMDRSQYVIKKMLELGKITKTEQAAALKEKVSFAPQQLQGIKAPHFVIAVQDYLVQKYGEDMVRGGGLKVITTLDWNLQQAAEKAVLDGATRNEEQYGGKNAAIVSEDPKTGQILAMVGSRDYFDIKNEGNFNVATQGLRQPGSALKPFVYMTAFEKGYTPDTVLFDVPTEFDTTGKPENSYTPENFDGVFRGPINLRQALAQSVNIPAVKTLYLVGLKNALKTVNDFGISTLNDPKRYGLSLVLGGGEVRLIDMVKAYSTLSQEGVSRQQSMILEISDGTGKRLESFSDSQSVVVDPQYPRLVNDVLSDSNARAALYQNSLGLTNLPGQDVALKTGTSNDYRDAWVFGYTRSLVTGVWAGNNDNKPMERRGSSILAALPIWHAYMVEATKPLPLEAFTKPDPATPSKPILRGDYLNNHLIHTILYFVNPTSPDGPYPANPEGDPQFKNWEFGVINWAQKNLPDFSAYNRPGTTPSFSATVVSPTNPQPTVQIKNPIAGAFVHPPITIEASLTNGANITEINVYLNSQLVQKISQSFGNNYNFSWQFSPTNLAAQNLIEVEAVAENGQKGRASVIVYK